MRSILAELDGQTGKQQQDQGDQAPFGHGGHYDTLTERRTRSTLALGIIRAITLLAVLLDVVAATRPWAVDRAIARSLQPGATAIAASGRAIQRTVAAAFATFAHIVAAGRVAISVAAVAVLVTRTASVTAYICRTIHGTIAFGLPFTGTADAVAA